MTRVGPRLSLLLCLSSNLGAQAPAPITDGEFRTLHARLSPAQQDKWEQIPWMTDLLAARRRSIAEKKPLFMWSMNGHPLGCT